MEHIEIDLEEMKKNEDMLNESFLRMYGTVIELILKQMFGMPIFGSSSGIKGKPEDVKAFARAVGNEKPVVAVMGSMATSAGYMTAIGTDRLFAREGSLTGSIGVLMQTADVTGLLGKIGVKPDTIKSGSLKAQPNPLEVTTPAARQAIKDVVMNMYGMFVELVAERRNMDLGKAKALADGRVYTGRQALANGLIDAIGSETEAVAWLEKTEKVPAGLAIRDVIIEHPGGALQNFVNGMVGKPLFPERLILDGLISLWQPKMW